MKLTLKNLINEAKIFCKGKWTNSSGIIGHKQRKYTKKVLKRIDIEKCLKSLTLDELKEIEGDLKLESHLTIEKINEYKEYILNL